MATSPQTGRVTQQNEHDAVIASGLSSDRVVTTGFANLSDGAKVVIAKKIHAAAGSAPRKRSRAPQG
jgi:multidrug efflux system membrane fusion protein